jgi:hypothetical protein
MYSILLLEGIIVFLLLLFNIMDCFLAVLDVRIGGIAIFNISPIDRE